MSLDLDSILQVRTHGVARQTLPNTRRSQATLLVLRNLVYYLPFVS